MFNVYLAGYISGEKIKECSDWRRKLREHYMMKGWDICFLDPLNGKEFAEITEDGLKSDIPPNAILHRDYQSVIKADLIVANLDTFGETRPLTGTICELAWAWEHHKPTILITKDINYKEHPFISYFASAVVSSLDELLEKKLINYFYKGVVNAVY